VDAFVAVSESLRRELVDVFEVPGSKIRVIPNGRPSTPEPTEEQRDEIRRSLGLEPREILVVWAGRFVREKDPVAAAGLARRLHAIAPEARLVIVGGGPLDHDVRAAVGALDPSARPVLTGERDDAPRLIAAADLLVSTSRTEGVPGVFVEALLAGVPVVAHDMGGVRDIVSDETGALVPPGDADRLAAAVASLVTDPAARAEAAHATRSAGARLDIARVADEYDALFRELLARPR
jgi:glycosyltransferase involved in cell wall biosynthesis